MTTRRPPTLLTSLQPWVGLLRRLGLLTCICLALWEGGRCRAAEAPPALNREFRAAWIATVANIDWPSKPGLPAKQQQEELLSLLDKAVGLNLNAIVLQVRPACDAIYPSELEPWSGFLTGEMGAPPSRAYDPLEFAVREAHRRGLQLHAWFNPYRASHPSWKGELSSNHISRTAPDSVVEYGPYLWLDPSDAAASRHSLDVIIDVVRRYDIDGVHFDDYFYPYPVTEEPEDSEDAPAVKVPFPDGRSWRRYLDSTPPDERLSRDDWRRDSINRFVRDVYENIKREKPHVLFGISPFGIWRPGHPESVTGFDAYEELYADSRLWLQEGWVDYFTPQLYWPVRSSGQSYPILLEWWGRQNTHQRPLWPGLFTSKVRRGAKGEGWQAREIVEQVRLTQGARGASGNMHFSMKALAQNYGGVADALRNGPYAQPAAPPECAWLAVGAAPGRPDVLQQGDRVLFQASGQPPVSLWALQALGAQGWTTRLLPAGRDSVALSELTPIGVAPSEVVVTPLDRLGREGPAARLLVE